MLEISSSISNLLGFSRDAEYNAQMHDAASSSNLPNADRLSMLAAVIVLAYSLNRFMEIPARTFELQMPGLFLQFEINDTVITALLVAGLAAAGTDWLLRGHPTWHGHHLLPHLILPAITALVIGIPLNQVEYGLAWWAGLLAGTITLVLVVVAEYIVFDTQDLRQPLAAASLTAVGFAIYLVLAVALKTAGIRLFFIIPALVTASWLVSVRSLFLRLHGEWLVYESAIVALLVGQLGAAIHYWPLTSIRYGLILLGPSYALTSLFHGLIEQKPVRSLVIEPVIVLGLSWLGAAFLA